MGKKKQPTYRLVAIEKEKSRDGLYIESLGHYNPRTDPPTIQFHEEKILDWLRKGALPSETVAKILTKEGIIAKLDEMKKASSPAIQ